MTSRWRLHRAGIINVYQYGDDTLHLAAGRLLLRGVLGSGKSTAANVLLPFRIDAVTRRINAAGEQPAVLLAFGLHGAGSTFVQAGQIAGDIVAHLVPVPGATASPDKNQFLHTIIRTIENAAAMEGIRLE